ncbi:hypothetical protein H6G74_12615 [Nostoc spongiaeforme FACHB-130]|uniref:Uncharacterized protein n=1 Tax=Nostoc spongiaeforme FACHB-130 TaxID=1357510 RepID=A0ABR8FY52_9NOSO|nr:hypothetical protein [Nostoc spongiaeforme]MBD2595168.1 hypothetical protein [Nostoc spongiaeforme FACHB-130]
MLQADTLPKNLLLTISQQISQQISSLYVFEPNLTQARTTELCETFSMWTVHKGFTDLEQNTDTLFELVGYWHQIAFDGQVAAFAQSVSSSNGSKVKMLGSSSIAKEIDSCIDWLEKNVKGDYSLRLLIIPFAYLYCFWLKGNTDDQDDQILLIQGQKLKTHHLYNIEEFMEFLSQELKKVHQTDPRCL